MLTLRRRDDGAIAVMAAILMVVLMGVGALTVDLGNAWARKRSIQSSADLAALAGAQGLPDIAVARAAAKDYVNRNVITGQGLTGLPANWDDNESAVVVAAGATAAQTAAAFRAIGNTDGEIDFYLDGKANEADTNGRPDPGEEVTSGFADLIRVVPPPATVPFGLARSIGGSSMKVQLPATARIGTALGAGTPPFFATTGDAGAVCVQSAPPGGGGSPSAIPAALVTGGAGPQIKITNVAPNPVQAGQTITITGTFPTSATGGALAVSLDAGGTGTAVIAVITSSPSSTVITAVVPSTLPTNRYRVTVSGGGWGSDFSNNLQVNALPPPPSPIVLSSVTANTGVAGATVTLTGTGLPTSGAIVTFATTTAIVTGYPAAGTQITVTVPTGPTGTVPVTISNGAQVSNSVNFTYTATPPAPIVLNTIAPNMAAPGSAVTLNGTGLPTSGAIVTFGTTVAVVTGYPAAGTQIAVTVPTGTGTVLVTVGNGSTTSNSVSFTYAVAGDPCLADSANRGAMDEPRFTGNAQSMINNIKHGLDHNLHPWQLWPVAGSPRTLPSGNPTCADVNSSYPSSIFKSGSSTPLPDINCAHLKSGSFAGPFQTGFFDDSSSDPGRLRASNCGSVASYHGHDNVDMTDMFTSQFVDTTGGRTVAGFRTAVTTGASATASDRGWLKADILNCPRFAILPVINPAIPVPNGGVYYPIIGFKAMYLDSTSSSCPTGDRGFVWNSGSLKALCGYVIDPGYLPATVSSDYAGVIGPYTGPGLPAVPLLTRDPSDRPS